MGLRGRAAGLLALVLPLGSLLGPLVGDAAATHESPYPSSVYHEVVVSGGLWTPLLGPEGLGATSAEMIHRIPRPGDPLAVTVRATIGGTQGGIRIHTGDGAWGDVYIGGYTPYGGTTTLSDGRLVEYHVSGSNPVTAWITFAYRKPGTYRLEWSLGASGRVFSGEEMLEVPVVHQVPLAKGALERGVLTAPRGIRFPAQQGDPTAIWDPRDAPELGCPGGCAYLLNVVRGWIVRYAPAAERLGYIAFPHHLPWSGSAQMVWDPGTQRAYIFGAWRAGWNDGVLAFDPVSGRATVVGRLPFSVESGHAAAWDPRDAPEIGCAGGCAYVLDVSSGAIARFHPQTGSAVTVGARMPAGRWGVSAAWDGSHVIFIGGLDAPPGLALNAPGGCGYILSFTIACVPSAEVRRYDPLTDRMLLVSHRLPAGRGWAAVAGAGGDLYLLGGASGCAMTRGPVGGSHLTACPASAEVLRYQPGVGFVGPVAMLPSARSHGAAVWDGTRVLQFGGLGGCASTGPPPAAFELPCHALREVVQYEPPARGWAALRRDLGDRTAYASDFEGPGAWHGWYSWRWTLGTGAGASSGTHAWSVRDWTSGPNVAWLVSPRIVLPVRGGAALTWTERCEGAPGLGGGRFVEVSADDGLTWQALATSFCLGTWQRRSADLGALAGLAVRLRFTQVGGGMQWALDDVNVRTSAAPYLDADGDSASLAGELAGNSHPMDSASTPDSDEDGDGVANQDQKTRLHALGSIASSPERAGPRDRLTVNVWPGSAASVAAPELGFWMQVAAEEPVQVVLGLRGDVLAVRRLLGDTLPGEAARVVCAPRVDGRACLDRAGLNATWVLGHSVGPQGPAGLVLDAGGKRFDDLDGAAGGGRSRNMLMPTRLWNWHAQQEPTYRACAAPELPKACLSDYPEERAAPMHNYWYL